MRVARGCGNIAVGPAMSRLRAEGAFAGGLPLYALRLAQRRDIFGVEIAGNGEHYASRRDGQRFTGSDAKEVVGIGANLPPFPASIIKWTSCGGRLRLIGPIRATALMCCRR